jgi:hypothetical protein
MLMREQFSGRRGQRNTGAVIYHRKSLICKGFVDWTRDTAGVARLLAGDAELSVRDVLPIRFDSFSAKPGRAHVWITVANQWLMVIVYRGRETALVLAVHGRGVEQRR